MTLDTSARRFVRKLASIYPLTEAERQAASDLPMHIRDFPAGHTIVRDGDRATQCCLLLDGFAYRQKTINDGRRQVLSFHIPGEMPDLMSLHLQVMDHDLSALTRCTVGFISHPEMRRLIRDHPRIGDALWRDTLIDAAVFREWMIGMGRRNARSRIAHLLCELMVRMQAVGLAADNLVHLPITQVVLADATGLTTVHVNRVLQELRSEALIELRSGDLKVKNWAGLQRAADFDPAYLHLSPD